MKCHKPYRRECSNTLSPGGAKRCTTENVQPAHGYHSPLFFQLWNMPVRCDLSLWCSVILLIATGRGIQYRPL